MIPRLLSSVYRRCRKIEKDTAGATQVEVALEYFEIYCDRVFDLFEPPEKRTPSGLPIRDNHGKTVIVGLTEKPCTTLKEFEHLYDQANLNRSTSATKVKPYVGMPESSLLTMLSSTHIPPAPMLYFVSRSRRQQKPRSRSAEHLALILRVRKTTGEQITTKNGWWRALQSTSLCSYWLSVWRLSARSRRVYRTANPK
jgi:hypothetical protein